MKHIVVLAALVFLSFTKVVAQTPAQAVRSGNIVTCDDAHHCTRQTVDGHAYYVLTTPQMAVKVAIDADNKYNRVAVSVENRSSRNIEFSPADFRIEITEPRFKRLNYIEPTKLKLPKGKAIRIENGQANCFMGSDRGSEAVNSGVAFLLPSILAPSESAAGAVFFERSSGSGMSLLLPIAGTIFEFAYLPPNK